MNKFLSFILAAGMIGGSTSCCSKKCETLATEAEPAGKVRLNVFVTVSDERLRPDFVEIAKRLVEASRNDAGCISYDFLESTTLPGEYMIIETWENDSLLQLHSEAPHFMEYVPQLKKMGEMRTERFVVK